MKTKVKICCVSSIEEASNPLQAVHTTGEESIEEAKQYAKVAKHCIHPRMKWAYAIQTYISSSTKTARESEIFD